MNKLLLILLALVSFQTLAQTDKEKYALSVVDGVVIFSEVIKMDNIAADKLYAQGLMALAEMFKSAKDVIQLSDKDNKVIIAKGVRVSADKSNEYSFMVRIAFKDGRYKIDLTNFVYTRYPTYIGNNLMSAISCNAEDLTDDKCFNQKGELRKLGPGYMRRFLIETKSYLLEQFNNKMKSTQLPVSQDDNW